MIRDSTGAARYYGLYRGIVADNRDPQGRNRVKLQVPQVFQGVVTDWAMASTSSGVAFAAPQIGQGVWVQFEGGDPSYPVWSGTFGSNSTVMSLGSLSDVSVPAPIDGDVLRWSRVSGVWYNASVLPKTIISGTAVTLADTGSISNSMLLHSAVTINGTAVSLGNAITVQAVPTDGSVTTTKLAAGAVTTTIITDGNVTNPKLQFSSVTINGTTVSLGGGITIQAVPTAGSVDSTKIVSGGLPTSSITNLSTYVTGFRLDQFAAPTTSVGLNGTVLTNAGTPTNTNDVATKGYVDAIIAGLNYKQEVKATTTGANIALSGTMTLDGVALVAGDRVLVKDQTTGSANGIYVVAAGAWARSSDGTSLKAGTYVYVDQGALYADSAFVLTTNDPITVGTTSLTWAQFSGAGQIIAGNGIVKTGNQLAVQGTANRISVSSGSVDIDANYVGQATITTVGTITTGTWSGSVITVPKGGTGQTAFGAGYYVKGNGTSGLTAAATIPATDVTGLPAVSAPTGEVTMFAGSSAPTGWLLCDGSAVSRTTYSALFAVVSTTYGTGDGSTTFNVPNLKGRAPVGVDSTQTEFAALGTTGGEKTHVLSVAEMPSHTHQERYSLNGASGTNMGSLTSSGGGAYTNAEQTTQTTGGGGAHNNLQPYLSLNFIIKT